MSLFPKAVFIKGQIENDKALIEAIQSDDYETLKNKLHQMFNIDLDFSQLHLCNKDSDNDLLTIIITHDFHKFTSITIGKDFVENISDFLKK